MKFGEIWLKGGPWAVPGTDHCFSLGISRFLSLQNPETLSKIRHLMTFHEISWNFKKIPNLDKFLVFWRLRNLDIPKEKQWSGRRAAQGPPFSHFHPNLMKFLDFIDSGRKIGKKLGKVDFGLFLWFPAGSHPAWTSPNHCNYNGLGSSRVSWREEGCVFHFL